MTLKNDRPLFDRLAARGAEYARSTLSRETALNQYEAFLAAIAADRATAR